MKQEMFTPRNLSSDEGASLSERYQLGEPVAVYKIAYTPEDIRRYRSNTLLLCFIVIYFIAITVVLCSDLFLGTSLIHYSTPFILLFQVINVPLILHMNSLRRKWGNWPLIGPRDRQLRVYVYPQGLIKQIDRRSDVVLWSVSLAFTISRFNREASRLPILGGTSVQTRTSTWGRKLVSS